MMREDLIDEIHLLVHPVVVGSGKRGKMVNPRQGEQVTPLEMPLANLAKLRRLVRTGRSGR
jgi:hypothetical protein